MDITEVLNEYREYDTTLGVDKLLTMKHNLSILIYECSKHIAKLEEKSKEATAYKKIHLATSELEIEGTGQFRKNQAIVDNETTIIAEAKLEGQLKAYKIKYDGMVNLSNSMASFLSKL